MYVSMDTYAVRVVWLPGGLAATDDTPALTLLINPPARKQHSILPSTYSQRYFAKQMIEGFAHSAALS